MIINTHSPVGVVLICTSTLGAIGFLKIVQNIHQYMSERFSKATLLKYINNIPLVKYEIDKKINDLEDTIQKDIFKDVNPDDVMTELPEEPGNSVDIIDPIKDHYRTFIDRATNGAFSGTVYVRPTDKHNEEIFKGTVTIYKYMQYQNPLHTSDFPIIRQKEAEVVSWIGKMYGSEHVKDPCGVFTSGGTESNMAACRAYFNLAKDISIKDPIILAPISAHDSILTKAKDYGQIMTVIINPETLQVDLNDMERLLKKYKNRVIAIVGSTPTYAHGIMDPIDKLAELAQKYNVYFHVDSCLGSLIVPFIDLDQKVGFANQGVTSISVDTHKYGYAPKGSSVILFGSEEIMKYQYYTNADWQGGLYATPGQAGSRSGVHGVATNYVMLMYGRSGYKNAAQNIIKVREQIQDKLSDIEGIEIMGDPKLTVLAIKSDLFDVYILSDLLKEDGIHTDKMQGPPCNSIHIGLTQIHISDEFVDRFVDSIKKNIKNYLILQDKVPTSVSTGAQLYGQAQTISKENPLVIQEVLRKYVTTTLRVKPKNLEEVKERTFTDIKSRAFKYFYEKGWI